MVWCGDRKGPTGNQTMIVLDSSQRQNEFLLFPALHEDSLEGES